MKLSIQTLGISFDDIIGIVNKLIEKLLSEKHHKETILQNF